MMHLAAFVITFNRPKILRETILSLLKQTRVPEVILVVDNGNAEQTEAVLCDFDRSRVLHHHLGDNPGCAAGEAHGLHWLSEQGYEWIYGVDDDDPPATNDTVERLLRVIACKGNEPDVAGVAAFGTHFDWSKGETKRLPDEALQGIVEVDTFTGNSQYILRRDMIKKVGLPNPNLFIDFEDAEYFLRIRQAGYRLLVDGDLMRDYRAQSGRLNMEQKRLPKLRKIPSPWRRYYSTRNFIYAMRNTFHRPDLARREALKSLARSIYYLRYGLKVGAAFSAFQLRGVLDGYRGRMGRTVLPRHKHNNG